MTKTSSTNHLVAPNEIPAELADPKFAEVRQLLIDGAKASDRFEQRIEIGKFFNGMSETHRAELAPFCVGWFHFLKKSCPFGSSLLMPPFFPEKSSVQNAFLAAKVAVIACCSYKDIQKILKDDGGLFIDEPVEVVLHSRQPKWINEFLLFIAQLPGMMDVSSWKYWRIYRKFIQEGIIKPVRNDYWTRTMVPAMLFDTYYDDSGRRKGESLAEQLKNDLGLLESDIWYLFDFERFPTGWNLTSWDAHFSWEKERRKGEDWKGTICTLVQNGEISKERVIDGCFQSLGRPFSDHESKWYAQLLEQMVDRLPILDDELVSDSRYLDLIHNANPTPRSLGLKILERLFKSGKIADKDVISLAAIMFTEPAKGKAKKAVGILEKIAKRNSDLRGDVFQSLLDALQHEATEIQQAAVDLLIKYGGFDDPHISVEVQKIAPSLAASVRKSLPENIMDKEFSQTEFVPDENMMSKTDAQPLRYKDLMAMLKNLAAKEPHVQTLATDKIIDVMFEGRMTPENTLLAANEILKLGIIVPTRWLKPLQIIAEQSERHSNIVLRIIEGIVPTIDVKNLGGFLELLYELCIVNNTAIESNECLTYLTSLKGTGKAAKLAKKLLEI